MTKIVEQIPQPEVPANGSLIPRAGGGEKPPCQFEVPLSEQDAHLLAEVLAATNQPAEQLRLWAERTGGASQAAFYRWRAEALNEGGA
jgi:hypothetical protein